MTKNYVKQFLKDNHLRENLKFKIEGISEFYMFLNNADGYYLVDENLKRQNDLLLKLLNGEKKIKTFD